MGKNMTASFTGCGLKRSCAMDLRRSVTLAECLFLLVYAPLVARASGEFGVLWKVHHLLT